MKTYSPAKVHQDGTRSIKISTTVTPSQLRYRREPSELPMRMNQEPPDDQLASGQHADGEAGAGEKQPFSTR